jgi:hypothetical protein
LTELFAIKGQVIFCATEAGTIYHSSVAQLCVSLNREGGYEYVHWLDTTQLELERLDSVYHNKKHEVLRVLTMFNKGLPVSVKSFIANLIGMPEEIIGGRIVIKLEIEINSDKHNVQEADEHKHLLDYNANTDLRLLL